MRRALVAALLLTACARPPSTALFAHPWPDERMRRADGSIDVSGFPWETGTPLRLETERALEGVDGFGVSSGVFFPFDAPLDPSSLPDVEGSTQDEATVFVMNVDPRSPSRGRRTPIDVRFLDDAGPYGGTNLLAALPYPGLPLEPDTLHAAVVTTRARDAEGAPLVADPEVAAIEAGAAVAGLDGDALDAHRVALAQLRANGVTSIAARAVFRTGDPSRGLRDAFAQAVAAALPTIRGPAQLEETHEDYCVFFTEVDMPVYQRGEPPYHPDGGGWAYDDDGALALQRWARSRAWITVPRAPMPGDAYPTAVFVRTGGGGDRPLVDRGRRDASGESAPGTGPAVELARAGYAGISVDGPLGGARNLAGWDEQFALFNVLNPAALRDNTRQTALELALLAEVLDRFEIGAAACPGASADARLDGDAPALIGHSMGGAMAPLAAAVQPRYRALILSGAGGSWIRQVIHKESPVPTRPLATHLFGYGCEHALREHDPLLSYLQWAGEPADPVAYAHALAPGARPTLHVLVFQGVLDTYIPPAIANPIGLSLHGDLAGEPLDRTLSGHRSYADELPLRGGGVLALPVSANAPGGETRAVTQHFADGIEDGHEILFQRAGPRRQLGVFLRTLRDGPPTVAGTTVEARSPAAEGGADALPSDS